MTKDICVFIETKDRNVRKASLELLSKGKEIAEKLSSQLYAVIIGHNVSGFIEELKPFSDKIIVAEAEILEHFRWDTYGEVLEKLLKKYSPYLFFGASTITGKDLFPRLSARLKSNIISDAVDIQMDGTQVKVKKPIFGGKVLSWLSYDDDRTLFITFRPNSFAVIKGSYQAEILIENIEITRDERMNVLSIDKGSSKKVDLQEADFIICGGRGMKGPEHFQILEEIADIMNGRVGASRAVVDSKWREYDDQIGKSGKTVSPKLYIGCGVSGALHHTMGMDTSKIIVAINKDPNAPIFQYADYGIVDDLFTILPILKEKLKQAKDET